MKHEIQKYDVVIVGGGAAGLSGAMTLARSRRSVAVIDSGEPRNAPAKGIHGLLGNDGTAPSDYLARGRVEVASYGGEVIAGRVLSAKPSQAEGVGFELELQTGRTFHARRLLVTAGLHDELPDIRGLRERWGREVLHCPYCHGWEVRDQRIGIIATGPISVHQALLFRQLSARTQFFARGIAMQAGDIEQLEASGITIVHDDIDSVQIEDDRLAGIRLVNGTVVRLDAIAVSPRMVARADFLASLGLNAVEHPMGVGEHIVTDPTGRTTVPGVWAAGNVTDLAAQVGAAGAAGNLVAAQINADLVAEDTERAVLALRNLES